MDDKEGHAQDDQGYGQEEEDGNEEPYEGVQLQEGSRNTVHLHATFLADGLVHFLASALKGQF